MNVITLSGIYDKRTLKLAQDNGVTQVCFDFRPRSFNFIQKYVLEGILDDFSGGLNEYFLIFENEPDFMIKDILDVFSTRNISCKIIFTDNLQSKYYDQFGVDYFLVYHEQRDVKSLARGQRFQGIIFHYSFLHDLANKGTLHNFMSNLYSSIDKHRLSTVKFGLAADWDSNFASTILDLLDFEFIYVSLNSKVEVCYRNIDSQKLSRNISHIKNLTC